MTRTEANKNEEEPEETINVTGELKEVLNFEHPSSQQAWAC